MSIPEFLLSCVLAALDGGVGQKSCEQQPLVAEITAAITEATEAHNVPGPVIAAVAFHESGMDPSKIGADGLDIGLMQIRRGGAIPANLEHLSDRALQNVRLNVSIAASYLGRMMRACPRFYLSRYNGRGCRQSSYSSAVLSVLARFATKAHGPDEVAFADHERLSEGPALQPLAHEDLDLPSYRRRSYTGVGMPGLWFFRRLYRRLRPGPSISMA